MREYLSLGTIGHNHLLAAGQRAFGLAGGSGTSGPSGTLLSLGARLFAMAWAEFPLNAPLAAEIARLSKLFAVPALTPQGVALARRLAAEGGGPEPEEPNLLFEQGDFEGLTRFFERNAGREPLLPLVRQAWQYQGLLSRWEWLEEFLRRSVAPRDPEVANLLLAEAQLAAGRYDRAATGLEKMARRYGPGAWGLRLAVARAEAGDADGAMGLLGELLADFPEHSTALLYLDSLAFPSALGGRLEGGCAVSIYSYDKARELERTLESVLDSDLGPELGEVTVRVLVNGSRDDSLAVAEEARVRFGGTMDIVALPVNVGAPAARNWLLDAALRDGARWIAYLDDDVLVPRDWLSGLAAGVRDFPEAGVWGCRVADVRSPSLTQHGDGFLLWPEDAARAGRKLTLQEPCAECLVPPLLSYRRYAGSVTGCCHLFEAESLAASNGFDLAYSPSQFDDLDLDLRRLAQGKPVAYLGDVVITHLRESTHFLDLSPSAAARSRAHQSFLEERHAPNLEHMLRVQSGFVKADLEARRARLRAAGLLA
ncbi:glycosyltransferase family A protein [Pseudodesulfovibrio indicus]|uniref:Glycosyltransferase 2-like domain-containing protein n=1 Tax=Pseudodesulfovibrio indicus TaxID=1716143 RepID=A0A126QQ53_9BACT|nr:glycosyltransferase family A protein [Pseudodesulfovibrio indicus]AMK12064.1 hypothetical protein AWY79_13580 [Pseudodesulfovibrio indicus]TDT88664.1 hypothetical protein EDC59_10565 [Pseudodesulfovibrio indicus]